MNGGTMFVSSLAGLIVALTTAYVAWRKLRPETAQIVVTSAERVNAMTLEFASNVAAENNELQREINELRAEFYQYRKDTEAVLDTLKTELRAERLEKATVKRENAALRARVDELENEVARLKGETGATP